MSDYYTTRDIVIPAGTAIGSPPSKSSRWGHDYEAVVGVGRDHSGYFSMDLDEAIESGLIQPKEPNK